MAKAKKIKECGKCGVDWQSGYLGWYGAHHGVYCRNCGWNDIPRRWHVFKERYDYWYRLYRIRMRSHQVFPYKWEQPLDIIMESIHETYAKTVPFWIQPHIEDVYMWKFKKDHAWIFQSASRWEYHLMLANGEIKDWSEFQTRYKQRSQSGPDYQYDDDDENYYDEPYGHDGYPLDMDDETKAWLSTNR
jgi:hypothetical protein